MRPVLPANLLGTPAAVVPAGTAEGLPVGVQVMGGKYTDLRCLAVAEAIERRLGTLTPINPVTDYRLRVEAAEARALDRHVGEGRGELELLPDDRGFASLAQPDQALVE